MSASDLVAVLLAVVCLATTAALAFVTVACVRTMREMRAMLDSLRVETVPLMTDLRSTVQQAGSDLERVEGLLDRAETIAVTVDAASKLTYRALRPPLIRTMSLVSGVSRAGRRLKHRRPNDNVIETIGRERRALGRRSHPGHPRGS